MTELTKQDPAAAAETPHRAVAEIVATGEMSDQDKRLFIKLILKIEYNHDNFALNYLLTNENNIPQQLFTNKDALRTRFNIVKKANQSTPDALKSLAIEATYHGFMTYAVTDGLKIIAKIKDDNFHIFKNDNVDLKQSDTEYLHKAVSSENIAIAKEIISDQNYFDTHQIPPNIEEIITCITYLKVKDALEKRAAIDVAVTDIPKKYNWDK